MAEEVYVPRLRNRKKGPRMRINLRDSGDVKRTGFFSRMAEMVGFRKYFPSPDSVRDFGVSTYDSAKILVGDAYLLGKDLPEQYARNKGDKISRRRIKEDLREERKSFETRLIDVWGEKAFEERYSKKDKFRLSEERKKFLKKSLGRKVLKSRKKNPRTFDGSQYETKKERVAAYQAWKAENFDFGEESTKMNDSRYFSKEKNYFEYEDLDRKGVCDSNNIYWSDRNNEARGWAGRYANAKRDSCGLERKVGEHATKERNFLRRMVASVRNYFADISAGGGQKKRSLDNFVDMQSQVDAKVQNQKDSAGNKTELPITKEDSSRMQEIVHKYYQKIQPLDQKIPRDIDGAHVTLEGREVLTDVEGGRDLGSLVSPEEIDVLLKENDSSEDVGELGRESRKPSTEEVNIEWKWNDEDEKRMVRALLSPPFWRTDLLQFGEPSSKRKKSARHLIDDLMK